MSKFRILFNPKIGCDGEFIKDGFDDFESARKAMNLIGEYTLMLHERSLMPDYSNYGEVQELINGEWEEAEIPW